MAKRNPKTLKIRWRDDEGDPRYIDPIPYEWFRDRVVNEDRTYHFTNLHRGGRIRAICRINISENTATLYYGPDNNEQVHIGTTRVTFDDKRRRRVRRVEWKWDGEHDDEYEEIQEEDFWLEFDEAAGWKWWVVLVVVILIVVIIVWW